jgi:hypothetical protein
MKNFRRQTGVYGWLKNFRTTASTIDCRPVANGRRTSDVDAVTAEGDGPIGSSTPDGVLAMVRSRRGGCHVHGRWFGPRSSIRPGLGFSGT